MSGFKSNQLLLFYWLYLNAFFISSGSFTFSTRITVLQLELNDVLRPVYIYLYLASLFHSSETTHYVWVSQTAFSWPTYTAKTVH